MTDIVEVTENGLVVVDNNTPVQVVREVDFQIVEVIGAGPPGPPGLPNPVTDGSDSLGTTSLRWDGLWLYPNSVINWDSGDLTLSHSANLLTLSGGVMEFSSRPTFAGSGILAASDIGVTVQAYDPDLQSWLAVNRAAGFDTFVTTPSVANLMALLTDEAAGWTNFMVTPSVANLAALLTDEAAGFTNFLVTPSVANLMTFLTDDATGLGTFMVTPSVANLMSLLTNDAAGLGDFMVTPSSANLRTLVTDETGTGVLVFGTSPTFTTGMNLSSGFVFNWNSSDLTLTHSLNTLTLTGGSLVLDAAGLTVGASVPFSDSAGTLTLQNVDALDATTEATIEAAIDTLANLTSIQSRAVSLGGAVTIGGTFTTVGAFSTAAATSISTFAATYLDDVDAATTRATLGLTIGTHVQAWDADLDSWALLTRAAGFDTFVTTPSVANLMSLLTNDAAGLGDFMVTPSSANLRTLVTDETGTGVLVFATSPSFTTDIRPATHDGTSLGTSALGFSDLFLGVGGVITWGAASTPDITLTHSADTLTFAGGQFVFPAAGITVGASIPFSDSAGTLTLQNVDALDATTEATIEAAIDTLANLTSIQGVSFTFGSYAATILNNTSELGFKQAVNLEIGVDVQAYDADLASWAGITRASGFDTFATTPSVANLMSLLTDDASGFGTFMVTPSSANLAALVTDETGSGALVFGTTPTFTTSMLLSSGFVMNWNSSDVTLTHSADTLTLAGGSLVLPAAGLTVGASVPFSDSAGTLTLQNVDALDATTEATIEAAVDTLANLTSIQGRTVTLADAGVDAFLAWDDSASAYQNISAADATAILNVFVGDSGSGGTKGLVPAPVTGDATKFLRGDGVFVAIPGGGDALTANSLAQFAATTSAELAGVISDETGSGALVFATSPTLVTPILGTPTSGTLTNCTGLPLSGVVDSTSEALGVGSLEVGHATDTTVSRASAGDIAVEGNIVYRAGGTDVPVADGGTGASDAATARTNLGVAKSQLEVVFDNGTIALTTGVKGEMRVPFACTITSWTLVADASGSIVIDIWKDTYANYPPTDSPDSITASAPPTLSSVDKNTNSTLTGWTTSLAEGDILRFNIDSITTCKRVTLSLAVTRA